MTDPAKMSPLARVEHMNDLAGTLRQNAYSFEQATKRHVVEQERIRDRLKELYHASDKGALGISDLLRAKYPWGEEYNTIDAQRAVNQWFMDTGIFIMDTFWETNNDQQVALLINPTMSDDDLTRTASLMEAMMGSMSGGAFTDCNYSVKGFMLPLDRDPHRLPYFLIYEGDKWKVVDEYYMILRGTPSHKQPTYISDTLLASLMYIRDYRPYRKELLRA